jgi:hypothetical protein
MEKEIILKLHKNFEQYVHQKNGVEFWYARELQNLLGYNEWRNFEGVVEKAKIAFAMTCFAIQTRKQEIYPEILPAEEDVKKMERRINSENKKLLKVISNK